MTCAGWRPVSGPISAAAQRSQFLAALFQNRLQRYDCVEMLGLAGGALRDDEPHEAWVVALDTPICEQRAPDPDIVALSSRNGATQFDSSEVAMKYCDC